jgi:PAS domain S-box-containing protein
MASLRKHWAWLMIITIALLGIAFSSLIAQRSDQQLRRDLLLHAQIVAETIDQKDINTLSFTLADRTNPAFIRLGNWMKQLAQTAGCRSLYSLVQRSDGIVFGPENLSESDPFASPPGTLYKNPPKILRTVFQTHRAMTVGPYTDEYGTFVGAFAPVINPSTGKVILVIGMDIEATDWKWNVISDVALPIILTIFLMFLLIVYVYLQKTHMALRAREAALHESEDKYRQLAETSHDSILTVDLNFKITYTNKAALNFTGVIDPVGMSLIDFTPQYLRPLQEELMQKRREGFSDMLAFEWEIIHPSGKISTFDIRATLLTEDRKPSGVMFVARDVTERKRIEGELRERNAKMDSIFRAAPTGIGVVSNRILVEVNQRICEMTGYSREELVGNSSRILYQTQEDFDFVGKEKYRQIQLQGTGSVETRWRRKNGTIIDIILSSTPVDTGDLSVGVTFTALDITERKKAEEESRKLASVVRHSRELVNLSTPDGMMVFLNDAGKKMLGISEEDIAQTNIMQVIPEHLQDKVQQEVLPSIDEYGFWEGDLQYLNLKTGGLTDVHAITYKITDPDTDVMKFLANISLDITERKRAEEQSKTIRTQLVQAQKMESIGTLAGGIAHDFNNILSAIIGYSELAMEDVSDPQKAKREIKEVLKAADRAKELAKHILTFSRKADVEYSPLSLRTVVKDTIKMLRSVIPTTIDIQQDLTDSGLIMSNPTQINQILMNLSTNASHAMDKTGGVLKISLKKVNINKDSEAHELNLHPGNYLILSVSDTGHGIPSEILERIFEPYFTTKDMGRGTGLGLSVVHGIVISHGGNIICKSTPGKGTSFEIYLPEIESMKEVVTHEEEEPTPTGTEHILFIDDESVLVNLAEKMLIKLGYTIETRTSSSEALELFQKDPDKYDLIITDMTMPGMTGDRLAQKYMEIRPDIPIILCSGYSEHISKEKAKNIGIREFVMKPLEMKALAKTIRKVLAERQ